MTSYAFPSRRAARALMLATLGVALATPLAAQTSTSPPTSSSSPAAPAGASPAPGSSSPLASPSGATGLTSTNNGFSALTGFTSAAVSQDDTRFSQPTTTLLQDQRSGVRAAPFGAQLFATTPASPSTSLVDPNYELQAGDTVNLALWGLVNENQTATVDSAGNIVVPGVGPVHVAGTPAAQVNQLVQQAASGTYKNSVQLYATPATVGVTNVYVSGLVTKPGSYPGSSNDNLITYLQRSGGPDAVRGSYRDIVIKRKGQVIGQLDLYAFLLNGVLPDVKLHEGDTVVVGSQHPIVTVTGDVRAPFTFEFAGQVATGSEVIFYTRPNPSVTDVAVLGIRNGRPSNFYLPLAKFSSFQLFDGDRVRFDSNARAETYLVTITGAFDGPSAFTVPRGATLGSVISQLHLDADADVASIHLQRVSIAQTQKQLLDEDLARLEKVIYTTPSPTPDIAQARAVDAIAIQNFVNQARSVIPPGLLALPPVGPRRDAVLLEPDDQIVVPFKSETVSVGGEVQVPQSLIWQSGKDAKDYIRIAGGFTPRAKRSTVLVVHPDGTSQIGGAVRPGDRVLAPPKAGSVVFELIKDLTSIIAGFGIAAAAVTH